MVTCFDEEGLPLTPVSEAVIEGVGGLACPWGISSRRISFTFAALSGFLQGPCALFCGDWSDHCKSSTDKQGMYQQCSASWDSSHPRKNFCNLDNRKIFGTCSVPHGFQIWILWRSNFDKRHRSGGWSAGSALPPKTTQNHWSADSVLLLTPLPCTNNERQSDWCDFHTNNQARRKWVSTIISL